MPTKKKTSKKVTTKRTTKKGTKKKQTKNAAAPKKIRKKQSDPVLYDKIKFAVHDGEQLPELTYDEAKEILGWQEQGPKEEFGNDYVLAFGDRKIRMNNNRRNRFFKLSNALSIKQSILRGNWRMNGQPLIIGHRGGVISAQHRLVGFILAVEEWREAPSKYPDQVEEPTLACVVEYGVDEDDDTIINTVDTGKARTLTDIIFRSAYFQEDNKGKPIPPNKRLELSRAVEYGIRLLWDRTGARDNAYSPNLMRTHEESIDFLERHPKLIECVWYTLKHPNKILKSQGTCAGLLYLMGAVSTTPETYNKGEPPTEDLIDWDYWELAKEFWEDLAEGREGNLSVVFESLDSLLQESVGTTKERMALIIKAWNYYVQGEEPTQADLKLRFVLDGEGENKLDDFPLVGGIDKGKEDIIQEMEDEPDEEEVQKRAKAIRREKSRKTKGKVFGPGDKAYVIEENGGHWHCEVKENPRKGKVLVKVSPGFTQAGRNFEIDATKLTDKNPTAKG